MIAAVLPPMPKRLTLGNVDKGVIGSWRTRVLSSGGTSVDGCRTDSGSSSSSSSTNGDSSTDGSSSDGGWAPRYGSSKSFQPRPGTPRPVGGVRRRSISKSFPGTPYAIQDDDENEL